MTEDKTQEAAKAASDLNAKLDVVNNNMMRYWIGTTEVSHYLTSLVDEGNLNAKDEYALNAASSVIDELRAEVKKLRAAIKQEADYCYGWAANAEMMGDDDRAKRHKERGDRLMSNI